MLAAMDLGIANDGQRAGHEQAAQIAVTLLADTAEPVLAPAECCFGTSPIQAEKLRPDRKTFGWQRWQPKLWQASDRRRGSHRAACSHHWTGARP